MWCLTGTSDYVEKRGWWVGVWSEDASASMVMSTALNFFIIKPTRCTNFTNLFWHETLHVSDSSSVHHQQFIHYTPSNGISHTAFEQDQDGTAVPSWS